MNKLKQSDFTGYSKSSLEEAMNDALRQAGKHRQLKIIETRSSQFSNEKLYQVTLAIKGVS